MSGIPEAISGIAANIVSSTLLRIGERVIQEAASIHGVRKKVEWIQKELRWMQDFLRAADRIVREGHGEEVVRTLVAAVRDAANEAEDAIETFICRAECNRRTTIIKKCAKVMGDVATLRNIAGKIENLKGEIDDFLRRRSVYATTEIPGGEGPKSHNREFLDYRGNVTFAKDKDVIGFDGDVESLVQQLTAGDARLRVISIVATGGAGKTTLANKVYHESRIKSHFGGCLAWAYVSQTCNPRGLLQDIANQVMDMSGQDFSPLNPKVVQDRLFAFLRVKKYLIVLDDMWKADAWDQLKGAFPDMGNGSRIMLTTRSMSVALNAESHPAYPPYQLPFLTQEDSWNLFLKKTFPRMPMDKLTCPANLNDIAGKILAKCNGLPMAIEVIGHQLATSGGRMKDWKNALGNLKKHLSYCSKILALSYYDLPPDLKPCFLYLSLFPKEKINVEKLKMIWAAEHFIQASEGQSEEDIAESYLKELIDRSMIQVVEREWDGTVVTCRIHDLLRDFAISEAKQHHFLEIDDGVRASIPNTVRRLAISNNMTDSVSYSTPKLRSFICFARSMWKLKDAKLLRVLDLEGVNASENELLVIGKELFLLKYLNLKHTKMETLPPSICKHYNLETLLLHDGTRLPQAIWKMERLRHLHTFARDFEGSPRFDCLRYLQTLHLLFGNWIQDNSLSTLSDLKRLYIRRDVSSNLNVLWSSVEKLLKLQSLVLDEFSSEKVMLPSLKHHSCLNEMVLVVGLERLPGVQEFPQNLTKLDLQDNQLEMDPMPILGELMALESLRLGKNAYHGKIMRSKGLPQLRYLQLECLMNLEQWIVLEGSMPQLESLHIQGCKKLNMLPEGMQYITTLRQFEVVAASSDLYLRLQENDGVDWQKIKHVRHLHIPIP